MITDQTYLSNPALNQSLLKAILISPSNFLKKQLEQAAPPKAAEGAMLIGSACDTILTQGIEAFNEHYGVLTAPEPAPQIKKFIQCLVEGHTPEVAYDLIEAKVSLSSISAKAAAASDYQEQLVSLKGKSILNEKEYNSVQTVLESLKTNTFVLQYFHTTEAYTNYYQVPVEYQLDGVLIKGLIDCIHIDHRAKKIVVVDFKVTESPTEYWEPLFWKMRYDFQAATYLKGVQVNPPECIHPYLKKGYEVVNGFVFVVESFSSPGAPLSYLCSPEIIEIGFSGGLRPNHRIPYEGLTQAIDRYKWHTENNIWHYTRENYISQGVKWISL